ncbi:MAG: electron transfer flavoprotein subunit alpha/FixB family protein [bacterium]
MDNIFVLVEHMKGNIADISFEMLGIGRKIADQLGLQLNAVIIGNNISSLSTELGTADSVILIDNEKMEMPCPAKTANLLKSLIEQKSGSIVLIGSTNVSSGVGPILSHKLNLHFLNFCKNIVIEDNTLIVTSQLFGGKIFSEVILPDNKGVISIYPGSFPVDAGKSDKIPMVEDIDIQVTESGTMFKNYIEPEAGDIDITKENILISVGRGIENSDNISLAEELISSLGGAICASRPVIDQGWLPLSRQVGKSGMIVKPKLYFALGISGAPEHVEGMKDSGLIIAINKDPAAPIFNYAHYGICADLNDIVPSVVEELKKRKS